jgi:hypothetical protein
MLCCLPAFVSFSRQVFQQASVVLPSCVSSLQHADVLLPACLLSFLAAGHVVLPACIHSLQQAMLCCLPAFHNGSRQAGLHSFTII